jgi:hypothetical protein
VKLYDRDGEDLSISASVDVKNKSASFLITGHFKDGLKYLREIWRAITGR